jgi:hypothetical protein
MSQAVIGLVRDFESADFLVKGLTRSGFCNSDISILAPDAQLGLEKHSKAPEGTATGAAAGGIVGGALGLLAGIGALSIPGAGPFIAAGPIMATLSGIALGGTAGGVTGGLIGLGIPELEAKQYEDCLRNGDILVSVHAEDSELALRAKKMFEMTDAKEIHCVNEEKPPRRDN